MISSRHQSFPGLILAFHTPYVVVARRASHKMLLQRASFSSLTMAEVFSFILLLSHLTMSEALVFCSRENFGVPQYRSCMDALSSLRTEEIPRFFVEQQLRTTMPDGDWPPFVDHGPGRTQKDIVQIPKWWTRGERAYLNRSE